MTAHDNGEAAHRSRVPKGPVAWIAALAIGLLIGAGLTRLVPAPLPATHEDAPAGVTPVIDVGEDQDHAAAPLDVTSPGEPGHENPHAEEEHHYGPRPAVPLWLVAPFALLLGSIAVMPFINRHVWHDHYPDFAFLLGGVVTAYYLLGYNVPGYSHGLSYGQYNMLHAGLEYYAFIALVGGLYVASGGVLVNVTGKAGPILNTALLAFGAVVANVVGTTGASVLLIRPFMRINEGRLRPIHVVMFIFIVSNCGGCLTPIGDPPLYLGYLKGVPFTWTLDALWPMWLACVGALLAIFFALDSWLLRRDQRFGHAPPLSTGKTSISVRGGVGLVSLGLIIGGVFIDPMLSRAGIKAAFPVGATFQIVVAIASYLFASREIQRANDFTFEPVKEVGLLFIGIFATMAPALGYLAEHGPELGLDSPTSFYFMTGSLSAVLDNAPTYLNFLQVAFSNQGLDLDPENVSAFIGSPTGHHELAAISLGAVFFGAMTYIGNGPNFMVKAIAEGAGLRMPSFFGYLGRSCVILLPVLVLMWAIFVR